MLVLTPHGMLLWKWPCLWGWVLAAEPLLVSLSPYLSHPFPFIAPVHPLVLLLMLSIYIVWLNESCLCEELFLFLTLPVINKLDWFLRATHNLFKFYQRSIENFSPMLPFLILKLLKLFLTIREAIWLWSELLTSCSLFMTSTTPTLVMSIHQTSGSCISWAGKKAPAFTGSPRNKYVHLGCNLHT